MGEWGASDGDRGTGDLGGSGGLSSPSAAPSMPRGSSTRPFGAGDRNVRDPALLSALYSAAPLPLCCGDGDGGASGWSGVGAGENARGSGEGLRAGSAFSLSLFGVAVPGVACACGAGVGGDTAAFTLSVSILPNMVANRDCGAGRGWSCALLVGIPGDAGAGDFGAGRATRFSLTTISSIAVGARTFLRPESFSCRYLASASSLADMSEYNRQVSSGYTHLSLAS